MIQSLSINPGTVNDYTVISLTCPYSTVPFPLLQIDRDSYVVGLEIQSGINFDYERGGHCVQIGKYCSIAEKETLLIDLNHDYKSVFQGEVSFLGEVIKGRRLPHKCSIFIENDVWVGHGVTIMSGVTIHNGAVIAANTLITKDIPAYAIVGGVPARILGYRFPTEVCKAMEKIAWWNWDMDKLMNCRKDFLMEPEQFTEKYLPQAETNWGGVIPAIPDKEKPVILFISDLSEPFPLWKHVLSEYFSCPRPDFCLLIYIGYMDIAKGNLSEIMSFLNSHEEQDAWVILQEGMENDDLRSLFACADYYITTRYKETIKYIGYAGYYGVRLLYGTDTPVFSI